MLYDADRAASLGNEDHPASLGCAEALVVLDATLHHCEAVALDQAVASTATCCQASMASCPRVAASMATCCQTVRHGNHPSTMMAAGCWPQVLRRASLDLQLLHRSSQSS
jgi:hypothetical protein